MIPSDGSITDQIATSTVSNKKSGVMASLLTKGILTRRATPALKVMKVSNLVLRIGLESDLHGSHAEQQSDHHLRPLVQLNIP